MYSGSFQLQQKFYIKNVKTKKSTVKQITHTTESPNDFLGDKLNVGGSQCNCSVGHDLGLNRTQTTGNTPL